MSRLYYEMDEDGPKEAAGSSESDRRYGLMMSANSSGLGWRGGAFRSGIKYLDLHLRLHQTPPPSNNQTTCFHQQSEVTIACSHSLTRLFPSNQTHMR